MKVALCEAAAVDPEHDAGARADSDFVAGVVELGHDIRSFAENVPGMLDDLHSYCADVIIISRPALFLRLYPNVEKWAIPVGYLAHDLHHRRFELQSRVVGESPLASSVMKTVESYCFTRADLAILPTDSETAYARDIFPGSSVTSMRYFNMGATTPASSGRQSRDVVPHDELVFIGSSQHRPNRDGVSWFVSEVLPGIQRDFPRTTLTVVGDWPDVPNELVGHSGVTFTGQLSESELSRVMERASVGISPLRFGAGMKRKTLDYLSRGLPVVSTTHGVEGLEYFASRMYIDAALENPIAAVPGVIVADDTHEWVTSITRLLSSPDLRQQLGTEGHTFVTNSFSHAEYLDDVERVLTQLRGTVHE